MFTKLLICAALTAGTALYWSPRNTISQGAGIATTGDYKVDPVHSCVVFRIRHAGVSNFHGRFNDVSGSLHWDAADASKSTVQITISTESIDTNNEARDKHLRSPDFLATKQYPTMEFKSTKVKATDKQHLEVTGNLTLHGQTKEITVQVEHIGAKDGGPQLGYRAGFETRFEIKRSDFGMDTYLSETKDDSGMLGNTIAVIISAETIKG